MNQEVELVSYIVKTITGEKDCFDIDRSVDENGVLLTLNLDQDHFGRVVGKDGVTAMAIRTILRQLAGVHNARYSLKIEARQ